MTGLDLKDELQLDVEALQRVEKLMVRYGISNVSDDEEYNIPEDSLRGTIARLINDSPAERWTVQKVLQHLRDMKYDLRAQKPMFSVSQALGFLAKTGRIGLLRKGAGSAPTIYGAITPSCAREPLG